MNTLASEIAAAPVSVRRPTPVYRPFGTFRFFLAMLVVLQHFQHLLPEAARGVFHVMGLGAVAVAVFFAVSGFVVSEANATFYAARPAAFLVNRLLRIVPPYFAALLLSVVVHAWLWQQGQLVLWDYTLRGSPLAPSLLAGGGLGLVPGLHSRIAVQDFEFIPFVWTLRVEVAFYTGATLSLLAARRWGPRIIPAVLVATLLASAMFLTQGRPGLLSTAPMFLAGVGVWAWRDCGSPARLGFLAVSVALMAIGFASWNQHGLPKLGAQLTLLGLLLAAFFAVAEARLPVAWQKPDRFLGDLSYPLYLNHYAVGIWCFDTSLQRGWMRYGLAVLAAIGLAWAMGRLVETPLHAARDRIRRTRL